MATHLIADTHFGHAGIVKLCHRPFLDSAGEPDVDLMDRTMIEGWNAVVRKDDTVIHCGDFAHRADTHKLWNYFERLNGKKILVRGNHDGPETLALPWASQHDILCASIDSTRVVICHYAMRTWPGVRKGTLMLYGHNHGRLPGNQQSMDIGVDVMGFAPVRLNTIKARLATLPPIVDPEGGDELDGDEVGGPKP